MFNYFVTNEKVMENKNETGGGEIASIEVSQFFKTELRVGQILAAMPMPSSEKTLKLEVDIGAHRPSLQILAGIGKHYPPQSLIGRKVVVVANLVPTTYMGERNEGLLLSASDDKGNLELVSPGPVMSPGSAVR